jgi:hypothetical protein
VPSACTGRNIHFTDQFRAPKPHPVRYMYVLLLPSLSILPISRVYIICVCKNEKAINSWNSSSRHGIAESCMAPLHQYLLLTCYFRIIHRYIGSTILVRISCIVFSCKGIGIIAENEVRYRVPEFLSVLCPMYKYSIYALCPKSLSFDRFPYVLKGTCLSIKIHVGPGVRC